MSFQKFNVGGRNYGSPYEDQERLKRRFRRQPKLVTKLFRALVVGLTATATTFMLVEGLWGLLVLMATVTVVALAVQIGAQLAQS